MTGSRGWLALDFEGETRVELRVERDAGRDGRALHSGERAGALQELLLEGADGVRVAVPIFGQHGFGNQHVRRIAEARADVEQPVQGADHQAGADHQDQG